MLSPLFLLMRKSDAVASSHATPGIQSDGFSMNATMNLSLPKTLETLPTVMVPAKVLSRNSRAQRA